MWRPTSTMVTNPSVWFGLSSLASAQLAVHSDGLSFCSPHHKSVTTQGSLRRKFTCFWVRGAAV